MTLPVSNDHNVYILGAGFSVTAGLPVMGNFLNRMRDALEWLQSEGRTPEAEAIERVLKYRLDAASAAYWATLDLENVEQLFSLASAAIDPVSDALPIAIAATLEFALQSGPDRRVTVQFEEHETAKRLRVDTNLVDSAWKKDAPVVFSAIEAAAREGRTAFQMAALLGMFNDKSAVTGQNTFITFNYDTLVENALTALGVSWTYGFEWNKVNFKVPAQWGRSKDGDAIPVLKLHGSVNWGHVAGERLGIFESYEALRVANGRPRLIAPTWNKGLEDQISSGWKHAIDRLKTATRIVIIGFSMPETDLHFRYLLAAGLQSNAWLRTIDFVNIDIEGVEKRARAILKPTYIDQHLIRFLPATSEGFAGALAGSRPSFTVLMPSADTLPLGSPIQINIGRKAQEKLACRVTDRRPTL